MRLLVLAVALVGFAGCLEVDSPDGTLQCSTVPKRACPEGFYCLAADNTCWRVGDYPEDMATPTHWQPGPGDDLSIAPDDLSQPDDGGSQSD
ncbi:MAG: hypothetical protein ACXVCV_06855 [Polyangia bacterium]